MGSYQYWAGRVYDLYVYFMTGTPKGSTESGFMEKPGIEPATTGLQDIGGFFVDMLREGQSVTTNNKTSLLTYLERESRYRACFSIVFSFLRFSVNH